MLSIITGQVRGDVATDGMSVISPLKLHTDQFFIIAIGATICLFWKTALLARRMIILFLAPIGSHCLGETGSAGMSCKIYEVQAVLVAKRSE